MSACTAARWLCGTLVWLAVLLFSTEMLIIKPVLQAWLNVTQLAHCWLRLWINLPYPPAESLQPHHGLGYTGPHRPLLDALQSIVAVSAAVHSAQDEENKYSLSCVFIWVFIRVSTPYVKSRDAGFKYSVLQKYSSHFINLIKEANLLPTWKFHWRRGGIIT